MKKIFAIFILLLVNQQLTAQFKKDYLVTITTPWGDMHAILHDQTPQHKANFLKLVDNKFYDGLLFHRIINTFMIQGGDPQSRTAAQGMMLGNGDVGYKIPAEISPNFSIKRGRWRQPEMVIPQRLLRAVSFMSCMDKFGTI